MSHTKRVGSLGHRRDRDVSPAPERDDRRSASTHGRRAVLLVSALGVLLAFAGSAAAGTLITGKKIKDDTITSVDLRDGRLQGVDIRDGSLTRTDFAPLPAGDQGPQGTPGLRGPDGARSVNRPQQTKDLMPGEDVILTTDCPEGTHVVGGGLSNDRPQDLYIEGSYPTLSEGWTVRARYIGGVVSTVTVTAVCVQ
jgi:hypothetical protein